MADTQICAGWCGLELEVEAFPKSSSGRPKPTCKACTVLQRLLSRGGIALRGTVWRIACSFCSALFTRVASNGERRSGRAFCSARCRTKASMLRFKFGLEPEEFRAMWREQGGLCAMPGCFNVLSLFGAGGHHVDHDHVTGHVRGLLCGGCNRNLGGFEIIVAKGVHDYLAEAA